MSLADESKLLTFQIFLENSHLGPSCIVDFDMSPFHILLKTNVRHLTLDNQELVVQKKVRPELSGFSGNVFYLVATWKLNMAHVSISDLECHGSNAVAPLFLQKKQEGFTYTL